MSDFPQILERLSDNQKIKLLVFCLEADSSNLDDLSCEELSGLVIALLNAAKVSHGS